jgi:hypothetical protein
LPEQPPEDADNADKKNCAKPGKFADEVKAQPVYADNQDTMIAGKAVKGYGQCWLHVVVLAAADLGTLSAINKYTMTIATCESAVSARRVMMRS